MQMVLVNICLFTISLEYARVKIARNACFFEAVGCTADAGGETSRSCRFLGAQVENHDVIVGCIHQPRLAMDRENIPLFQHYL